MPPSREIGHLVEGRIQKCQENSCGIPAPFPESRKLAYVKQKGKDSVPDVLPDWWEEAIESSMPSPHHSFSNHLIRETTLLPGRAQKLTRNSYLINHTQDEYNFSGGEGCCC